MNLPPAGHEPAPVQLAMSRSLAACLVAEIIGTFLLVFLGCGAVHSAVLTGSLTGLWQVGIVWGLAIMLAIYATGAISGAHINPAITIGMATWKLFPRARVVPYVLAQLVGAFLAAAVLYSLFGGFARQKEQDKHVVRGEPGSEITATCYGEYFPNPGSLANGDEHTTRRPTRGSTKTFPNSRRVWPSYSAR